MNNHYTIYCHLNKINNKAYIGQTGEVPYNKRWSKNEKSYLQCTYFYSAIKKYGWQNFEHFVILENLSLEEANYWENTLILLFDTTNPDKGYNLTTGGNNFKMSELARKNIKNNHADFKGSNHPLYGKHHSEETKEKMRQKRLGFKSSEETKKKISEKTKGKNNPRAKKVLCLTNGMIFDTAKDAANWAKVDYSNLCKCCKGKRKTIGNDPITKEELEWQYLDN